MTKKQCAALASPLWFIASEVARDQWMAAGCTFIFVMFSIAYAYFVVKDARAKHSQGAV